MGIGNLQRLDARRAEHPAILITPHGDRKLRGYCSGKGWCQGSLPLMGIGNPARQPCVVRQCHSPLITPHGDRKLQTTARRLTGRPEHLITPHGDRKPATRMADSTNVRISLPLMGIGNTTPRSYGRWRRSPHYPSWGSETRDGVGSIIRRYALITPHGDRKPAGGLQGAAVALTSLPLMGIGNMLGAPTSSSSPAPSLPLMGIGNARSCACSSEMSRRSLPLMGIGNPVDHRHVIERRAFDLITPHGDRKPDDGAHRRHRPGCLSQLITPHGDRKPPRR